MSKELIEWARACQKQGFHSNLGRVADAIESLQAVEGWKLVPVEPTKAMRRAGADVWSTQGGHIAQVTGQMYRAMLAAAPKEGV